MRDPHPVRTIRIRASRYYPLQQIPGYLSVVNNPEPPAGPPAQFVRKSQVLGRLEEKSERQRECVEGLTSTCFSALSVCASRLCVCLCVCVCCLIYTLDVYHSSPEVTFALTLWREWERAFLLAAGGRGEGKSLPTDAVLNNTCLLIEQKRRSVNMGRLTAR